MTFWWEEEPRQSTTRARFTIVTGHKPIVPLFNRPTDRLLPRFEKWVMDLQDVDYELVMNQVGMNCIPWTTSHAIHWPGQMKKTASRKA